jgi:hypothetical protein
LLLVERREIRKRSETSTIKKQAPSGGDQAYLTYIKSMWPDRSYADLQRG